MASDGVFRIGATFDKAALLEAFQASNGDAAVFVEKLTFTFGSAKAASQKAFKGISDDVKEMSKSVTADQAAAGASTRALADAYADLRRSTVLLKDSTFDRTQALNLQAAALVKVREAEEANKAAQALSSGVVGVANATVTDVASQGGVDAASRAVATATLAETAAKEQLLSLNDALAASDVEEETKADALAVAQERVREAVMSRSAATEVLKDRVNAAAAAEERARREAEANATVQKAAAAESTDAQQRIAAASLEATAAKRALKEAQDAVAASTLGETEKALALAPALERDRLATVELAAANEVLAEASHQVVTGQQAASASIRTLEGNAGLRAIENFIAKTLGLGPAMQAIFPVIGALAFGDILVKSVEKVVELEEKGKHAGEELNRAFGEFNEKLATSNDELELHNSKLRDEIGHLTKHPTNGLETALLEAKVAADKLQEALAGDVKALQTLLKEHDVSRFEGLLAGVASTGKSNKDILEDSKQAEKEGREAQRVRTEAMQTAGTDQAKREAATKAYYERMDVIAADHARQMRQKATETAEIQKQLDTQNAAIAQFNGGNLLSPFIDGHIVGHLPGMASDLTPVRTSYEDAAEIYDRMQDRAKGSGDAFGLEEQKGALPKQGSPGKGSGEDKAAREEMKGFEQQLADEKLLHSMSVKETFDFWEQRRAAFVQGSEQYLQVTEKMAAEATAGAKAADEAIKKFHKAQGKDTREEAGVEKSNAAMAKWAGETGRNITRTGAKWEDYFRGVLQGQAAAAAMTDQMSLAQLRALEASGGITRLGAAQAEAKIHAEEHRRVLAELRAELERLNKDATRDAITGNVTDPKQAAKIQRAQNAITQEEGKGKVQGVADGSKIQQEMVTPYKKAFQTIGHEFDTTMAGILRGQVSISQGFRRMGADLVVSTIQSLTQMGLKWAEHEAMTLAAHHVGNVAKVASDTGAAAASTTIKHASVFSEIMADAKAAAAATWKAVAAIPIVGPALAPEAAAVTFAGVVALASFDVGTAYVPHDGVAMIHKGESILPPPQTAALMSALGGGGQGGDMHLHLGGNQFSAAGNDFHKQFEAHDRKVIETLRKWHRDGKLKFAG